LAFGLGFGQLTILMFLLGVLQLPLTFPTIASALLIMLTILFIILLKTRGFKTLAQPKLPSSAPDVIFLILISYVVVYVLYAVWSSLNIPLSVWDELESIGFKAHVFFTQQSLGQLSRLPHPTYPLYMPFALDWIALNLGRWDDQLIKILVPLTLICYLRIQYAILRQWTSRRAAIAGVALVVSAPLVMFHASIVYMDLTMMSLNCTAVLLLFLWHDKRDGRLLILAALFSGLGTFVKEEGLAYAFLHLVLICFFLRRDKAWWKDGLKFLLISVGIAAVFQGYRISQHITIVDRTHIEVGVGLMDRVPIIFKALGRVLFLSNNWTIIWLVFILSLGNIQRIADSPLVRRLLSALGVYVLFYILLFLLTPIYNWIAVGETDGTLCRLILHFFPLVTLLIVLLNARTTQAH
jgi:hypothetical protein